VRRYPPVPVKIDVLLVPHAGEMLYLAESPSRVKELA
jgi:hypothetical protein